MILFYIIALLVVIFTFELATPYMAVAATAYMMLVFGLLKRGSPKTHALAMSLGILTDLSLVLVLQFQRGAVQTAMSFSLEPLQQAHIAFSLVATLLYFPVLFLGSQIYLKNQRQYLSLHKKLGVAAFAARTCGFFLMYSMLN